MISTFGDRFSLHIITLRSLLSSPATEPLCEMRERVVNHVPHPMVFTAVRFVTTTTVVRGCNIVYTVAKVLV